MCVNRQTDTPYFSFLYVVVNSSPGEKNISLLRITMCTVTLHTNLTIPIMLSIIGNGNQYDDGKVSDIIHMQSAYVVLKPLHPRGIYLHEYRQ